MSESVAEEPKKESRDQQEYFSDISPRYWELVSEKWVDYIDETLIDMFSQYLDESFIIDHIDLIRIHDHLKSVGNSDYTFSENIPAIRTQVFSEAVFSLYKAMNIISASQKLVEIGYPTASSSSGYLASYFAAKSIMAFMGISYTEVNNCSLLIDLWPCLGKRDGQRKQESWDPTINFMYVKTRYNHKEHWDLFREIIQHKVRDYPWSEEFMTVVRKLSDSTDYTVRRNRIHYRHGWPYNDLLECLSSDGLESIGVYDKPKNAKKSRRDFDIVLGQILCSMAFQLLADLVKRTNIARRLLEKLTDSLNEDRYPIIFGSVMKDHFAFDG